MYDIPATKERHRTLGLARSHPNEAKRTFRYTDDFHSTSTFLLIPTITQTHPNKPKPTPSPHHPIIHPSIIHHPSPTTHHPSTHPSPSNSNSLSSSSSSSVVHAISTVNSQSYLFSVLLPIVLLPNRCQR